MRASDLAVAPSMLQLTRRSARLGRFVRKLLLRLTLSATIL